MVISPDYLEMEKTKLPEDLDLHERSPHTFVFVDKKLVGQISRIFELGKATKRKMNQNFVWATAYNFVAMPKHQFVMKKLSFTRFGKMFTLFAVFCSLISNG